MPFLSEEEVDELHKKIDVLEEHKVSLDKLNKEYKKKIKQKKSQQKGLIAVCIILFLCLLGFALSGFFLTKKITPAVSYKSIEPTVIRDTVYIEQQSIENRNHSYSQNKEILGDNYYGIQIGVYRKFDTEFTSDIQKFHKNGLIYYVLGHFETTEEAENMRLILMDLKVRGTVVVKIENGKLVD